MEQGCVGLLLERNGPVFLKDAHAGGRISCSCLGSVQSLQ